MFQVGRVIESIKIKLSFFLQAGKREETVTKAAVLLLNEKPLKESIKKFKAKRPVPGSSKEVKNLKLHGTSSMPTFSVRTGSI